MTLSSLILFAAVYFAAVATPGPGVAALIARVLGHGLRGVAPFIAGYFVGDMIWLTLAATGLAVAIAALGLVAERWLFFAEAKHTVMLYYGAEAV